MDVRIPFKVTPEGVQNADKSGGKVLGFIHFTEHIHDGIARGGKKTIKQFAIFAKKGRSSSGIVKTQ